ncbi:helix-turn-helix domain-containing protein [Halorientalis litorea]|uniref:helix-turn-helix domain-containing protein n=1 Tax=Halorientalis litorea TaxID=2931977 RepID=UPI001FF640E7|nr:helix-turn-helix domain-containing protein [Halorientalis litorea]
MSNDGEQTTYAAAFLRERIRSGDVDETHPHAGMVPRDGPRELLNTLATAFDSTQHTGMNDVTESELYQTILRNEGTDTLTDAVTEGNVSQMQYGIGQVDHEKDAGSGAYRAWLHPTLVSEATVMFVTGGMNAGKTDWGHGAADEWHMITRGRILSNLESAAERNDRVEHVETYEQVETLFKKSRDHFFLLVDETGQGLTGTGTDKQKADVLASLLKLVRKGDAPPGTKRCICFIGQTIKDLDKDLRRLVAQTGAFVHKPSKKKLEVYGDSLVSSSAEIQSTSPEQTFNGIPKSRITFDTTEEPTFDMSGALEDGDSRNPDDVENEMKEQHAQRLRDEGMSGTDIAEIVGMSKTWVYNHTEKPDGE